MMYECTQSYDSLYILCTVAVLSYQYHNFFNHLLLEYSCMTTPYPASSASPRPRGYSVSLSCLLVFHYELVDSIVEVYLVAKMPF